MRVGGGGTHGIITSMHLQLHDYLPLEIVHVDTCVEFLDIEGINDVFFEVHLDFLLDPSSIGICEI